MDSSLLIDSYLVAIFIVQGYSSIEVSFNSIPIFINEFKISIFILNKFKAILIKAMNFAVLILLNSIISIIMSNNLVARKDSNLISLFIVIMQVTIAIFHYPIAKIIIFLVLARFRVYFKSETIFGIINFPLSIFVFSYITTFFIF